MPVRLVATFAPEPRSAGAARRAAARALTRAGRDDVVDEVALLVSELVTNAILHVGSPIELEVAADPRGVRVEVRDSSPLAPVAHAYDDDATTGRGIGLVDLVADRWGVDPRPGGKAVWFELGDAPMPPPPSATPDAPARPDGGDDAAPTSPAQATGTVAALLQAFPARLWSAVQQHDDALLREAALRSFGAGGGDVDRVTDLLGLQAAVHAQLERAVWDVDATGEVEVRLPPDAGSVIGRLAAALDDADEEARRGHLLVPPALSEVAACRAWCLGELEAQLAGAPPTPWGPPADAPERNAAAVTLDVVDRTAVFDALAQPLVVADGSNRIVRANAAATTLLGWPPGGLDGRRLTTIIPTHLREAHVAGYTRFLVTGVPRLIGEPVRVAARHRDGSEVPVELLLSTIPTASGAPAFVGALRPLHEAEPRRRRIAAVLRAGHLVTVALAAAPPSSLADAADRVLPPLGSALGWAAGTAWDGADGELRCVATWSSAPEEHARFLERSRRSRFVRGVGLPGRVWDAGAPVWTSDLVADANFPRLSAALEDGLRAALAVPICGRGGVRGVLELFATEPHPVDVDVLEAVATVADLAGTLLDR